MYLGKGKGARHAGPAWSNPSIPARVKELVTLHGVPVPGGCRSLCQQNGHQDQRTQAQQPQGLDGHGPHPPQPRLARRNNRHSSSSHLIRLPLQPPYPNLKNRTLYTCHQHARHTSDTLALSPRLHVNARSQIGVRCAAQLFQPRRPAPSRRRSQSRGPARWHSASLSRCR